MLRRTLYFNLGCSFWLLVPGAHAREWIAVSTALLMLHEQAMQCLNGDNCEPIYYFMPAVNPDGYVFTFTDDRLWRKNRSKPPIGSECYGTDLNRNWIFNWGYSGSSRNSCSVVYQGSKPFSAPETLAEMKILQSLLNDSQIYLKLYISYHSYGQGILYPYGYSTDAQVKNSTEVRHGALVYSYLLKLQSTFDYNVMKSTQLYPASGTSDDQAASLGIPYAYTVELRDQGQNGFILPLSKILPTFQENWAGFKNLENYLLANPK